ncbi:MAG: hypothetical protein JO301_17435 [Chitinophagaceae bacterium]|nr:hypothetical protein [Chitinophagaceae bacterium]
MSILAGFYRTIDFSEKNVDELCRLILLINKTLTDENLDHYIKHLSLIQQAAKERDKKLFKKLVMNALLFGGAGALWELDIPDKQKKKAFDIAFCSFVDHLKIMGIKNGRINQVRDGFNI